MIIMTSGGEVAGDIKSTYLAKGRRGKGLATTTGKMPSIIVENRNMIRGERATPLLTSFEREVDGEEKSESSSIVAPSEDMSDDAASD